jgi:uncharacterized protein involved in exopolysaccharide biosynthesis
MIALLGRIMLVVAVAAMAGAAAAGFSARQPEEYQGTMRFQFGQLLSPELQLLGPDFGEADVEEDIRIATEAAGIDSFDVAERTARDNPELGYTAGQIAGRVSASPDRGTLIVVVRGRASSPRLAARLTDAYARAYLDLRREREKAQAAAAQEVLRERLAAVPRAELGTLRASTLNNKIADLEVLRRVGSGTPKIIDGARAAAKPSQPRTQRNVLFAVLFGLIIGIGMVALRAEGGSRARVAAARRAAARARADAASRE